MHLGMAGDGMVPTEIHGDEDRNFRFGGAIVGNDQQHMQTLLQVRSRKRKAAFTDRGCPPHEVRVREEDLLNDPFLRFGGQISIHVVLKQFLQFRAPLIVPVSSGCDLGAIQHLEWIRKFGPRWQHVKRGKVQGLQWPHADQDSKQRDQPDFESHG